MNKVTCDETKIVYGRQRAFLNGELVGLSCSVCKQLFPLNNFNAQKSGYAGKYRACKSCNKKVCSDWKKEGFHKAITSHQNWRAKKHGREDKLTPEQVDVLLGSAGFRVVEGKKQIRCQLTGVWTSNYDTCHVHPLRAGGNSEVGNIFFATRQVNALQGNLHLFEWLLTEKAQELVLPEYVEWLLIDLSHRNMVNVKNMIVEVVGFEGYMKLK
ncbi:hypothetical protein [Priestia megaterium]|uniref:hypothetical protein n=1 Tax=Priestia megaterium TaxID=1404 RepID=UPI00207AA348|nr:hypothetical protein [Priestia megaterium]USL32928.1 hypothetical protein LIT30_12265 [Priestia megaterium]